MGQWYAVPRDDYSGPPRTWQEAADTKEEHAAILEDMDRSRDEINDRRDWDND